MKYLCWVYDVTEPNLLAGLEMYIPFFPDSANHQPEYQWTATFNNTLTFYTSGQIRGLNQGGSGYDILCDFKYNDAYITAIWISRLFDYYTFANSSGSAWIQTNAHKKGYNDDNTGWRRLTWHMGA